MGIILTKASTMRIEKKKEEFQNKLENTVPACLMGAGMGVALVTLKNQPVRDKFVKIIDKTAKGTGKGIAKLFPKMEPALKKIGKKFAELPGWAKAGGAIILTGMSLVKPLQDRYMQNKGKIDQKYKDLD